MDFALQLGKRIRRARVAHGITQAELARAAKVGANYIPRLERGELVPSVEAAFRIARSLGISLDDLCGRTPTRRKGPDVQEVVSMLQRADAVALRRVADVIEALSAGSGRRAPAAKKK
ncbi:MAG: helix-turn-helix domain-containing protein [Polyangiaceae bacterium]|jgi:transcriptional regulator with XRE-family HTH domain|nr:helix-turn-helix domain-containing protein [Polyangiaceae bacterium]